MRFNGGGHALRKPFAVDRQSATGWHLMFVGAAHNQTLAIAQFGVQQTHGIGLRVIGTEGVGANQLGQSIGDMGIGFAGRAHLVQDHLHASLRRRPSRFRACQPAADNM